MPPLFLNVSVSLINFCIHALKAGSVMSILRFQKTWREKGKDVPNIMHYYQVFNYLIMFDSFITNKSFVIEAIHKKYCTFPSL